MSKAELPMRVSNEDGTVTVKLKEPVSRKGADENIEELRLKKPKARHIKHLNFDNITFEDLLMVGSKVSGEPMSVIDELCIEDTMEVVGVIGDFLPSMEKTGKTP